MAPGSSKWLLADLAPRDGFAMDLRWISSGVGNGLAMEFGAVLHTVSAKMPLDLRWDFAMDLRWICVGFAMDLQAMGFAMGLWSTGRWISDGVWCCFAYSLSEMPLECPDGLAMYLRWICVGFQIARVFNIFGGFLMDLFTVSDGCLILFVIL